MNKPKFFFLIINSPFKFFTFHIFSLTVNRINYAKVNFKFS